MFRKETKGMIVGSLTLWAANELADAPIYNPKVSPHNAEANTDPDADPNPNPNPPPN